MTRFEAESTVAESYMRPRNIILQWWEQFIAGKTTAQVVQELFKDFECRNEIGTYVWLPHKIQQQ